MLLRGGHVWGYFLSRTFLRKGSRLFLHLRLALHSPCCAPSWFVLLSWKTTFFHRETRFLSLWNAFPFIVKNYFLSSWNAFPFIKKWHLSEKNGHLSKNNGVFWKNIGHFSKKDGHFWKNLPRFSHINSKARCTFVFPPCTTPESSRFSPFSTRKWANK